MKRESHSRTGRVLASLMVLAGLLVVASPAVGNTEQPHSAVAEKYEIPMTCFPAPGAPQVPPCLVPGGLDPGTLDGTSGELKLLIFEDGTARAEFKAKGLDPSWVITAWVSYFFPGPGVVPPDPIFGGPATPPVAGVSAPVASTDAGFTEGLGLEPNQMVVRSGGRGKLEVVLDYNPLQADQGPLRNVLVATQQGDAPPGSPAEQPTCCTGVLQSVGSSYLRAFDANGFQVLDADGHPEIVRSPVPVEFMLLVIHVDGITHGINPGLPIFPFPGVPAVVGDHFVLGIFDLSEI